MRRKSVHAPKQTLSLDELMPDEAELGRLLADAAAGPEMDMLATEQNHLLHQAVLRIPAQLRIVLVLHDMEELTTEQVAQILGLQQGTVRVRLHRARLAVRKEMSRVLDGSQAQIKSAQQKRAASLKRKAHSKGQQRPLECRELFAGLSDYLDGRVEPRTCEEMQEHIEACPACVAFLRDLRYAIDRCHSLELPCDPKVALRLRGLLTQEYLRMIGISVATREPARASVRSNPPPPTQGRAALSKR
jgi:RNA polymerase sigma-70 factor (ECF subfamily)